MALTLGPPLWATGSWAVDAWADGTWATVAPSGYGIDDLTTCVSFFLETLLPGDQTYEYRDYLDGVQGATNNRDLNSAQWVDLNF